MPKELQGTQRRNGQYTKRKPWTITESRQQQDSRAKKSPDKQPPSSSIDVAALLKLSQLASLITGNSSILHQLAGISHENIESNENENHSDVEQQDDSESFQEIETKREPDCEADCFNQTKQTEAEPDESFEQMVNDTVHSRDDSSIGSTSTPKNPSEDETRAREEHRKCVRNSLNALVESVQGINESLKTMVGMLKEKSFVVGCASAGGDVECFTKLRLITQGLPEPAGTMEELEEWLSIADMKTVARLSETMDLRKTVRSVVQYMMKQELAWKFSWSGLGEKRLKTKHCFERHDGYKFLTDLISFTKFKTATRLELVNAIKPVFHGVSLWSDKSRRRTSECIQPVVDYEV